MYDQAIECYTEAIRICPTEFKEDISTFYQNRAAAYENLVSCDFVQKMVFPRNSWLITCGNINMSSFLFLHFKFKVNERCLVQNVPWTRCLATFISPTPSLTILCDRIDFPLKLTLVLDHIYYPHFLIQHLDGGKIKSFDCTVMKLWERFSSQPWLVFISFLCWNDEYCFLDSFISRIAQSLLK